MADMIDKFVEWVKEKMYTKYPFSSITHIKNDEEQYVKFTINLWYKGDLCIHSHIENYEDCNNIVGLDDIDDRIIMASLEGLADHVTSVFCRELVYKIADIQDEQEDKREK